MEKFGETRGGVGKVACWSTKVAISLKRVKTEKKLLWRAYRKSLMLFRFFLDRRHISTSDFASVATETVVLPYFCQYSPAIGTNGTNGLSSSKPRAYIVGLCGQNKAHRAIIFAIAQLSS